ncbi:carboxypeptidase M [Acrasis kona]|uniref:Carboxypeptidase M n=1 Tax=Acrasis kona TaxID=1008807 RepID=A0AAW2ZFL5_9EUKA
MSGLLSIIAVCCVLVFAYANNRPHDYSDYSIRITSLDKNERLNTPNLLRRVVGSKLLRVVGERNFASSEEGVVIRARNERTVEQIKERLLNEGLNEYYKVEETFKTSPDYQRYINKVNTGDTTYHNYTQLYTFLTEMNNLYPNMTEIFTIGQSVEQRNLYGIRINTQNRSQVVFSDQVNAPIPKPKVKYIGNIHGDETVGREILIHFIRDILMQYQTNGRIQKLLDSIDLYIVPSINPDGFELAQRENKNDVDMNRNFPDFITGDSEVVQPEVKAIKNWLSENTFVLSVSFHGGAVVVNYPLDGLPNGQNYNAYNEEAKTSEDNFFVQLSKSYAKAHSSMSESTEFHQGITNGAAWYPLYGGMQDYNYFYENCPEFTIELSDTKRPPAADLLGYYDENKEALVVFLENSYKAIGGLVMEHPSLDLVQVPCNITFETNDVTVHSSGSWNYTLPLKQRDNGFYYKLLLPASYNLTLSCEGMMKKTHNNIAVKALDDKPIVKNWVVSRTKM